MNRVVEVLGSHTVVSVHCVEVHFVVMVVLAFVDCSDAACYCNCCHVVFGKDGGVRKVEDYVRGWSVIEVSVDIQY